MQPCIGLILREFKRAWAAVYFLPPVCSILNYLRGHSVADSLIPFLIATAASLALLANLMQGYVVVNVGIFFRKKEPIRYWFWNLALVILSFLPALILILQGTDRRN